jgi:hypothetical protein
MRMAATELNRITGVVYFLAYRPLVVGGKFPRKKCENIGSTTSKPKRESCPASHYKSTIEHYPSGSVVARVLLAANPSVYPSVHESIAHGWRDKEMIQPHPFV